jgi:hypothetical protein
MIFIFLIIKKNYFGLSSFDFLVFFLDHFVNVFMVFNFIIQIKFKAFVFPTTTIIIVVTAVVAATTMIMILVIIVTMLLIVIIVMIMLLIVIIVVVIII